MDMGTVPGQAAGSGGPARSSPAHARSTPKPGSRCSAAGTHHFHQISGVTTSVPLHTPMKSSSKAENTSWLLGFGLCTCPLLGMQKGSNPGIKPSPIFQLMAPPGISGQRRTQGGGSCVWVTGRIVGHSRPSLRTAKSPWGLMPEQGLGQKPWHPLQLKHWWDFLAWVRLCSDKRFQCPQGENGKKKERKGKGGHA